MKAKIYLQICVGLWSRIPWISAGGKSLDRKHSEVNFWYIFFFSRINVKVQNSADDEYSRGYNLFVLNDRKIISALLNFKNEVGSSTYS